jgi:hypothetical protein
MNFLSRYTAMTDEIIDDMQKINNKSFDKSESMKFICGLNLSNIQKVINIKDKIIDICGKILTILFIMLSNPPKNPATALFHAFKL